MRYDPTEQAYSAGGPASIRTVSLDLPDLAWPWRSFPTQLPLVRSWDPLPARREPRRRELKDRTEGSGVRLPHRDLVEFEKPNDELETKVFELL